MKTVVFLLLLCLLHQQKAEEHQSLQASSPDQLLHQDFSSQFFLSGKNKKKARESSKIVKKNRKIRNKKDKKYNKIKNKLMMKKDMKARRIKIKKMSKNVKKEKNKQKRREKVRKARRYSKKVIQKGGKHGKNSLSTRKIKGSKHRKNGSQKRKKLNKETDILSKIDKMDKTLKKIMKKMKKGSKISRNKGKRNKEQNPAISAATGKAITGINEYTCDDEKELIHQMIKIYVRFFMINRRIIRMDRRLNDMEKAMETRNQYQTAAEYLESVTEKGTECPKDSSLTATVKEVVAGLKTCPAALADVAICGNYETFREDLKKSFLTAKPKDSNTNKFMDCPQSQPECQCHQAYERNWLREFVRCQNNPSVNCSCYETLKTNPEIDDTKGCDSVEIRDTSKDIDDLIKPAWDACLAKESECQNWVLKAEELAVKCPECTVLDACTNDAKKQFCAMTMKPRARNYYNQLMWSLEKKKK